MRSIFKAILLAAFFLGISKLSAQTRDGSTPVLKPGFALVKPQTWSPANQATVQKFVKFTDRTARGTPGAGYFVFELSNNQERQVPASQVVKIVVEPEVPKDILSQADCDALQKFIANFNQIGATYPQAASLIAEMLKPSLDAVTQFKAGNVRNAGLWEKERDYRRREIAKIETRLNAEIQDAVAAKTIGTFRLISNDDFLKLQDLAKTEPDLQGRLTAVKTRYDELCAKEDLDELLAKLENPNLEPSSLAVILGRLKKVPTPDSQIRRVIEQADAASQISNMVDEIKSALEVLFVSLAENGAVPSLGPQLASQIQTLETQFTIFSSGSPPSGINVPSESVTAAIALGNQLPKLDSLLLERDFFAADTAIAPLVQSSAHIGSKTNEAIKALQSFITAKLGAFSKLREEAGMLAQAGNKKEALAKYLEALAIMPNAQVAAQAEELKK